MSLISKANLNMQLNPEELYPLLFGSMEPSAGEDPSVSTMGGMPMSQWAQDPGMYQSMPPMGGYSEEDDSSWTDLLPLLLGAGALGGGAGMMFNPKMFQMGWNRSPQTMAMGLGALNRIPGAGLGLAQRAAQNIPPFIPQG